MIRPGATGIGVDLGLPVGGFVDVVHLPFDPGRWPALGTVTSFTVWWIDERPQIRLVPADPRLRREDFGTWIQQQAAPAAAAFRERQSSGPGGREASIEHPWLGTVRRHGDGQLIAHISIPPTIRPARASADTSAVRLRHRDRLRLRRPRHDRHPDRPQRPVPLGQPLPLTQPVSGLVGSNGLVRMSDKVTARSR
jgi:hypothetical protein